MNLLVQLQQRTGSQTRSRFVQQYQGLYLLAELPGSEPLGFRTQVASDQTPSVVDLIEQAKKHPKGERVLLRVEKSDRNTWKRRISVGRATNNDLILRHPSVSKLHAHFQVLLEGGREELRLSDAGSANGTLSNGRQVGASPDAAAPVAPADRLQFGDVRCELLDAGSLYDRLTRMSAATDDF